MRPRGDSDSSGREPDELRRLLREWKVPAPPPEIEEQLRQAFRRRPPRRRRLVWLAVAAVLVLLLAQQVRRQDRTWVPRAPEASPVVPPARPPSEVAEGPIEAHEPGGPATDRHQTRTVAPRAEVDVIVEPGQAELLAQLARRLRGTRQAPPGVSLPRIEVIPADALASAILGAAVTDQLPEHRTGWERIVDEWPYVHRSF